MNISNKYTRPSQKRLYNLSYHLTNSDNPRLRAKVVKLIKIIPERYNYKVVFTKRRIWFIRADKKFIQLMVEKQRIFLKIMVGSDWSEIRLHDWEDFRRIFLILNRLSQLTTLDHL